MPRLGAATGKRDARSIRQGGNHIEEDWEEDEELPARGRVPILIGAAIIMELIFLILAMNHSLLRGLGLNSTGPLDRIATDQATVTSAVVLGAGFVVGYFLYYKLGSRVGGVIAIPLAAVETLSNPVVAPYLLLGIGISYAVGELFFQKLLIYGRRLFYVYLTASVFVMVQLLWGYKLEPVSFSFIIPGIIAYNMHVDRDKNKSFVIAVLYYAGLTAAGLGAIAMQGGL